VGTIGHIAILISVVMLSFSTKAASEPDYRLSAGDEITIQVYQEDDLSLKVRLDETGTITYPYLGTIQATGQTVGQLKTYITEGLLGDILIKPSVNITVSGYRNYYIGGEVKSPGGYAYKPGLTVRQAITVAGGLSEWGSESKVEILREGTRNPLQGNQDSLVRPGDTITIKQGLF